MNAKMIQELRKETGAKIIKCKEVLVETAWDYDKALKILKADTKNIADKKSNREASEGVIESYVHSSKVGTLLEVNCETDFVARNQDFKDFVRNVAIQIVSTNPENIEELLKEDYIKNPDIKVQDLLNESIAKTGENIIIKRFVRFELNN